VIFELSFFDKYRENLQMGDKLPSRKISWSGLSKGGMNLAQGQDGTSSGRSKNCIAEPVRAHSGLHPVG